MAQEEWTFPHLPAGKYVSVNANWTGLWSQGLRGLSNWAIGSIPKLPNRGF